jgi:hypothetical protein
LGLRRYGRLPVEGSSSGRLGVDRVGLSPAPAGLAVGPVDLDGQDALCRQKPGESCAVGARALHADPCDLAEAAHPAEELAVARSRGGQARRVEDLARRVDHRCDVDIFVGIDPADHDSRLA